MQRFNLLLPEELHTKLKVVCAMERKDMSEVVRKLIAEYVEKAEKKNLIRMERARRLRKQTTDPDRAS